MNVLSLFAGIGGFDLGLEKAGFKTIAFCEIDKHCQKVLKRHWPNVPIFSDIKTLSLPEGYSDIIVGGFPCQNISLAGKKEGIIKGKQSSLWREYKRLINEIKPKYVIIENVEYLRKNGLGIVLSDLARIGYDAEWYCLTATGVCNLPHQRKRLFIIAYPSSQRCNQHIGKERQLSHDQEWKNSNIQEIGTECQPEPESICQILSRRTVDEFRNSKSDRESSLSNIRRVTNGIPQGMDENQRKQRVKQLGNAVVPDICELLGYAILEHCKKS